MRLDREVHFLLAALLLLLPLCGCIVGYVLGLVV